MEQIKIGAFIAKLRKEKKLTQSELGEKLGVSYKAISKWERGINMPDASLYKPLCDILGITIDELIAGENKTNKKKNKKGIIVLIFILILSLIIIIFNSNKKEKYPKITIDTIEVNPNDKNNLVNQLLFTNDNIWYYSIEDALVCTYIKTCYNLGIAINHKQLAISELKTYLDNTYLYGNTKRYILYDGGTTIYENEDYTMIFCHTQNDNNDIYIGSRDLLKKLNGNYCGHTNGKIKYFIRTYKILNIYPDNNDSYQNVTLNQFQNGIATAKISKDYHLEINKTYEFSFYTYKIFDDTIDNIFKEATIDSVQLTDKVGLVQKQESIQLSE